MSDDGWSGQRFQFGDKILSSSTAMKRKEKEREEIAQLTAEYLLRNKTIKVIPYGVRTDVPIPEFKH